MLGNNIVKFRKIKNLSAKELAESVNISAAYLSQLEKNVRSNPSRDLLQDLSIALDVTVSKLIGDEFESDYKSIELTKKDERDIKKDIDRAIETLTHDQDGLMFDGEEVELDEETKEFLKTSLENTMRLAKQKAKAKFTPNKYRK